MNKYFCTECTLICTIDLGNRDDFSSGQFLGVPGVPGVSHHALPRDSHKGQMNHKLRTRTRRLYPALLLIYLLVCSETHFLRKDCPALRATYFSGVPFSLSLARRFWSQPKTHLSASRIKIFRTCAVEQQQSPHNVPPPYWRSTETDLIYDLMISRYVYNIRDAYKLSQHIYPIVENFIRLLKIDIRIKMLFDKYKI